MKRDTSIPLTVVIPIKDRNGTTVGEKEVASYAGLLAKAHDEGLRRVATTLRQVPAEENGGMAIVEATIETAKGTFSGIGDASPKSVNARIAPHLIRMAETRAKARALRDAVNIGVVSMEELGGEGDEFAVETIAPPPVERSRRTNGSWAKNGSTPRTKCRGIGALVAVIGGVAATPAFGQDTTPPDPFGLVSPLNGGWGSATPTLQWEPTDDWDSGLERFDLYIDGTLVQGGISAGDTSWTLDPTQALSEGYHSWFVRAVNYVGLVRQSRSTHTIRVDATPPDPFTLAAPADNAWVRSAAANLGWNPSADGGSGLGSYEILIDGTVNVTGMPVTVTQQATITTTPGPHAWRAVAVDAVGNRRESTDTRQIRVDDSPPGVQPAVTVSVDARLNSTASCGRPIDSRVDLQDGDLVATRTSGSWCVCGGCCTGGGPWNGRDGLLVGRINIGTTWFDLGPSRDWTPSWGGRLYFGCWDSDCSNNNGALTVAVTVWRMEVTGPARDAVLASRTPTFSWLGASDGESGLGKYRLLVDRRLHVDDIAPSATTLTLNAMQALTEGAHGWSLVAVDAAGNEMPSFERYFEIDTVPPPPTPQPVSPSEGFCAAIPTPEFAWLAAADSGSGIAYYQLWIDNVLSQDNIAGTQATPAAPLADGAHRWSVIAVDRAGNASARSAEREILVALSGPGAFALVSPADNAMANTLTPEFRWQAATIVSSSFPIVQRSGERWPRRRSIRGRRPIRNVNSFPHYRATGAQAFPRDKPSPA